MIRFKELLTENTNEFPFKDEIITTLKNTKGLVGLHFTKGYFDENNKRLEPILKTNVKPFHADPLGIYTFPKEFVLDNNLLNVVQFPRYPFVYVIKPKPNQNILNLSKLTEEEYQEIKKKLNINIPDDDVTHRSVKFSDRTPGHKLWGLLESYIQEKSKYGIEKNKYWNHILVKQLGYTVLYDEGESIIHANEPAQLVFLTPNSYEVVDLIRNRPPFLVTLSRLVQEMKKYFYIKKYKNTWNLDAVEFNFKLKEDPTKEGSITPYESAPNTVLIKSITLKKEFYKRFTPNDIKNVETFVETLYNHFKNTDIQDKYVETEESYINIIEQIRKKYNLKKTKKCNDNAICRKYYNKETGKTFELNIKQYNNVLYLNIEVKRPYGMNTIIYTGELNINDKNTFGENPTPYTYIQNLLYIANEHTNRKIERIKLESESNPSYYRLSDYIDIQKLIKLLANKVFNK